MSTFTLKIIAILAMTADHIGATFFPSQIWLRMIGRLTMPIIAYIAAVGFRKTRSVPKYLLNLAVFMIVSEVPFYLLFDRHSNVIITIFLGIAALYIGEIVKQKSPCLLLATYGVFILASILLKSDWAFTGVLLILAFYYADGRAARVLLYPVPIYIFNLINYMGKGAAYFNFNLIHLWAFLALPLLCFYNGKNLPFKSGKITKIITKYFFYAFYPIHMLIILFIKNYII